MTCALKQPLGLIAGFHGSGKFLELHHGAVWTSQRRSDHPTRGQIWESRPLSSGYSVGCVANRRMPPPPAICIVGGNTFPLPMQTQWCGLKI